MSLTAFELNASVNEIRTSCLDIEATMIADPEDKVWMTKGTMRLREGRYQEL